MKVSMISLIPSLSSKLYSCLLVYVRNTLGSSPKVFGNLRKFSGNVRQRSCDLWTKFGASSEIFGKSSNTPSSVHLYFIIKGTLHVSYVRYEYCSRGKNNIPRVRRETQATRRVFLQCQTSMEGCLQPAFNRQPKITSSCMIKRCNMSYRVTPCSLCGLLSSRTQLSKVTLAIIEELDLTFPEAAN